MVGLMATSHRNVLVARTRGRVKLRPRPSVNKLARREDNTHETMCGADNTGNHILRIHVVHKQQFGHLS